LTDVAMGIVVFVILVALVRFIQRFLDVRVLQQTRMDLGLREALKTGIGYVGVVIAALVAINTAGIDLSGLAIIFGALSVGIGFGLQGVVNNFVSGLVLLIERPIKVGDWIVVGQDQGVVKRISVRSTEIQTFSNSSVILPNSELVTGRVTNWMHKEKSGRVELQVGVAYGSNTEKVREVLLDCVKELGNIQTWPQPSVVFLDFGDSALLFEVRFFIRNIQERLVIASDLRFAIDTAFRKAGITIPFPQRDVHIKDASGQADATAAKPEEAVAPPSGKVLPIRSGQRASDSVIDEDHDD
jgi:small-conductance mechanosensitive channel